MDNSKVTDNHELCGQEVKQLKVLHPEQSLPHSVTKPADPGCIKANPSHKPNRKPTLTQTPSTMAGPDQKDVGAANMGPCWDGLFQLQCS